MSSFNDDMNLSHESIRKKQSTIISIQDELKQKQEELEEIKKIEKDKTSVYGIWMEDCLKSIDNDNRFHRKKRPAGEDEIKREGVGLYIHPYMVYNTIMIRTQVYLFEDQRRKLAGLAACTGENVSELIREAIKNYIAQASKEKNGREQAREQVFDKAFGMWRNNRADFAAIRKSADRMSTD